MEKILTELTPSSVVPEGLFWKSMTDLWETKPYLFFTWQQSWTSAFRQCIAHDNRHDSWCAFKDLSITNIRLYGTFEVFYSTFYMHVLATESTEWGCSCTMYWTNGAPKVHSRVGSGQPSYFLGYSAVSLQPLLHHLAHQHRPVSLMHLLGYKGTTSGVAAVQPLIQEPLLGTHLQELRA